MSRAIVLWLNQCAWIIMVQVFIVCACLAIGAVFGYARGLHDAMGQWPTKSEPRKP